MEVRFGNYRIVSDKQRFIVNAVQTPNDGCIEWPYRLSNGYGVVTFDGRRWGAHRLALYLADGPPPNEKMHAAHWCGNRACVNPSHLRWATPHENCLDSIRLGRTTRGEKNTSAKLSEAGAIDIRVSKRSRKFLMRHYGVSYATISQIQRGASWGWLETPAAKPPSRLAQVARKNDQ